MKSFEKAFDYKGIPINILIQVDPEALNEPEKNLIHLIATVDGVAKHDGHTSLSKFKYDIPDLEKTLKGIVDTKHAPDLNNVIANTLLDLGYKFKR